MIRRTNQSRDIGRLPSRVTSSKWSRATGNMVAVKLTVATHIGDHRTRAVWSSVIGSQSARFDGGKRIAHLLSRMTEVKDINHARKTRLFLLTNHRILFIRIVSQNGLLDSGKTRHIGYYGVETLEKSNYSVLFLWLWLWLCETLTFTMRCWRSKKVLFIGPWFRVTAGAWHGYVMFLSYLRTRTVCYSVIDSPSALFDNGKRFVNATLCLYKVGNIKKKKNRGIVSVSSQKLCNLCMV